MVPEVISRGAPNTKEQRHPKIPIRSSSISRANSSVPQNRPRMKERHSYGEDSGSQSHLRNHDPTSKSTTTAQSPTIKNAHLPPKMSEKSSSCLVPSRKVAELAKVKRWAGLTRSVCEWDGLRKDPELWMKDGDCLVHLYGPGASRRGPSFCVPLRALRQKNCGAMLDSCYAQTAAELPTGSQESRRLLSFDNLHRGSAPVELYVPAPECASREESFEWHITTRNFFAYVLGCPLVGRQMGQTFVDLLERMKLFRAPHVDNNHDFLEYAENQGYRDLVECTDYALASLHYAERYKIRTVWIDAFTHCVGMGDSIALSPEYAPISRLTKALITRAYLEVDLHLDRVARSLHDFLQEDFSPTYLGLTQGARSHLKRFQHFLHNFYVDKFGYWPPPKTASSFPKALYRSMFYDFKNLYELLVDTQSGNDISSQKPASGGICLLQNLDHFNRRHNFTAQPHTLPLLPEDPQKLTRSLSSASQYRKTCDTLSSSAALVAATNVLDTDAANSGVVQAYLQFERTCAAKSGQREDKVTAIDARKVRWLLIYGMLQYLTSALRAPNGVRDTESPEYPLCCLVAGQSSWNTTTPVSTPPVGSSIKSARTVDDYLDGAHCNPLSIQPDFHREDYLASQKSSRLDVAELPLPTKIQVPSRQSSTRSFGLLPSLSIRSSRRNSLTLKPNSYCPIIVHGYGDGLNQATTQVSAQALAIAERVVESRLPLQASLPVETDAETSWLQPRALPLSSDNPTPNVNLRTHTRNRTPLLHTMQLGQLTLPVDSGKPIDSMSRSDSTSSIGSSIWTNGNSARSSESSADGERQHSYRASTAEHSGLLGGLVSVDGTRVSLDNPNSPSSTTFTSQRDIHPLFRTSPVQPNGFCFDFDAQQKHQASSANATDSIGVAVSAPLSHPVSTLASTITPSLSTMSIATEKRVQVSETSIADPVATPDAYLRKKNRSSDIFSGLILSSTELRDRYHSAIKRGDNSGTSTPQYEDLCNGSKSATHPPTVTKTSHATRMPSIRNRIRHDDDKEVKKERRISSLWRR